MDTVKKVSDKEQVEKLKAELAQAHDTCQRYRDALKEEVHLMGGAREDLRLQQMAGKEWRDRSNRFAVLWGLMAALCIGTLTAWHYEPVPVAALPAFGFYSIATPGGRVLVCPACGIADPKMLHDESVEHDRHSGGRHLDYHCLACGAKWQTLQAMARP